MKTILKNTSGISMVELVLVVAALGFLVFLVASLPNSINLVSRSQKIGIAREIAKKQIEEKRQLKYANLPYGLETITDSRLGLLGDGTETVFIEDCDPNICTQGEIAKQVKVTVSWTQNSKAQSITLDTIIAENGLN